MHVLEHNENALVRVDWGAQKATKLSSRGGVLREGGRGGGVNGGDTTTD